MTPSPSFDLRPHQVRGLDLLKASLLAGHRRPMFQAPCGYGKTILSGRIVSGALAKGKRVAFCVHSLSLIDQTFEKFRAYGIDPADMGVMQGDHPWRRSHAPVQICSAQTIASRGYPAADVVVIDEAHVKFKVYADWIERHYGKTEVIPQDDGSFRFVHKAPEPTAEPAPIFIGLTATPWAKGLGLLFDDLLRPTSTAELIEQGYLSPFKVFAPSHPDLSGIKTVAGDYHEGQLAERMSQATIVADVVSTWLAKAEGRSTLLFAVNLAHADKLCQEFITAGVPAEYVDADVSGEDRQAMLRRLEAGATKVICSVGTMTTGVDADVRCLSLVRPTKSEMLFVQMIGRVLRTAPGKDFGLILDHSDTHLRLGMVTDIDHDELDDGRVKPKDKAEAKDKESLPKLCGDCTALIPPGSPTCPGCGAVQKRPTKVHVEEGELAEFTGRINRPKGETPAAILSRFSKQRVYSELLGYAEAYDKKSGWVAHSYRDVFGVWPRGLNDDAQDPSGILRAFVRDKARAWKEAQRAKEQAEREAISTEVDHAA